ncbi:unnamed protein product, partial [Ectocarpus sp. 12 AP-2014]
PAFHFVLPARRRPCRRSYRPAYRPCPPAHQLHASGQRRGLYPVPSCHRGCLRGVGSAQWNSWCLPEAPPSRRRPSPCLPAGRHRPGQPLQGLALAPTYPTSRGTCL